MGGCCCCCSSGGLPTRTSPQYRYGQRVLEERVPLSPNVAVTPTLSTGLLVDTNSETSTIETYRAPPPPVPYEVDLGHPHTPPGTQEIGGNKNAVARPRGPDSVEGSTHSTSGSTEKFEDINKSDSKDQIIGIESTEKLEIELSKKVDTITFVIEEEDVCPTCLEEYDDENPKMMTKCDHHFHLSCILEWKERSETCPVCDQEMILCSPIDI